MKTRKAISPVLATVILVAITLIAAIAIAGFVFGLFGQFTGSPQITATPNLSATNGPAGIVTLYNSGVGPTTVSGLQLTYNGQTCNALWYANGQSVVPANGNLNLNVQQAPFTGNNYQCGQSGTTSTPSQGMSYSGEVTIGGGYQIPFTGVFR